MSHSARLRTSLASGRGVAAAAGAAVVLVVAPASTAAAGVTPWTKAWAEHEVREHFGAVTTVCLPLGGATHSRGRAPTGGEPTFSEFVCVFTTADGSRYTIHLKPRSRTTWTVLSMKRLGDPAAKAGGGGHSGGGGSGGGDAHGGAARHG